ncbi:helix-turn-helix transcriptional regulator (plasmid) [Paenibacillus cellulosilyticus]|nr:helix-turn-helix transcriptional regulator [Paenibacillus cellulosilyticus]QKS48768.1 helix-turn-helix transcriptional regulator [Paenibacillus cellulosilyticus]
MLDRDEFRLLRIKKRIRLKELAALLNCHKSHISNYENNRNGMSEEKVSMYRSYINEKVCAAK